MQLLTHAKPVTSRANTQERIANLTLSPPEKICHLPTPPSSEPEREEKQEDLRHIFAIGDCAETGAIQAGHTAYWQAEVAARNVCRLIEKQEGRAKETLESYKPGAPCIKLTLGLVSPPMLYLELSLMNRQKQSLQLVTMLSYQKMASRT